jgi:hypothetical protein
MQRMKRLAVLTSGGDAPGMNAAVRAVVRAGAAAGIEVWGVSQGYAGLLRGDFLALGPRNVGGIIERGGTILGSSRCEEMRSAAGPALAIRRLQDAEVDGLIVIGGNGSQLGALALAAHGFPVAGIASTAGLATFCGGRGSRDSLRSRSYVRFITTVKACSQGNPSHVGVHSSCPPFARSSWPQTFLRARMPH